MLIDLRLVDAGGAVLVDLGGESWGVNGPAERR